MSTKLDSTEWIFAASIAIMYPFFFEKLSDTMEGRGKIMQMCNDSPIFSSGYTKCYDERSKLLEPIDFKKHLTLVIVGIIGIILSGVIKAKAPKVGLGLGGLLTLIYGLFVYWKNYKDTTKLIILGISFIVLILLSIRLYSIDSIVDIFNIEFGTK